MGPIVTLSGLLFLFEGGLQLPPPTADMLQGPATRPRVVVECVVQKNYSLSSCVVLEDNAPGTGVAEATIEAAARFKMSRKAAQNGKRVQPGDKYKFAMNWVLEDRTPRLGRSLGRLTYG